MTTAIDADAPAADRAPRPRRTSSGLDYQRLVQAMMTARRMLDGFMLERGDAVRQAAGNHYGGYGNRSNVYRQPVNLLSKFVSSLSRKLVSRDPKVQFTTFDPAARPTVSRMQGWTNKKLERLGLVSTLQRQVVDAIFSVGIMKVALADPGLAAANGWGVVAGEPFASVVDLDDFAVDQGATDWREVGFVGNRYRIPLAVAKDFNQFDKRERELLKPMNKRIFTERGTERTDQLGPGTTVTMDGYEDMVDLWEVYLPRHRTVVTLACDDAGNPFCGKNPIREQRWVGPDHGPYHCFQFDVLPGNLFGKSPVMDLIDLDWMANQSYRKVERQVARAKKFGMVRGAADQDGKRIVNVNDGEVVRVDDPDSFREIETGGVIPGVMAVAEHFRDMFSTQAGNMNAWAGLEPSSKTATQDKMLSASASEMITDMQAAAVANVKSVVKALCWYWWHDPFAVMRFAEEVPHAPGKFIRRELTPADRQAVDWESLEFSVNPYSVLPQSPQQQAAMLAQIVTTQVIPLLPLLQQEAVQLDAQRFLKAQAELLDLPVLAEVLTLGEPPAVEEGGSRPAMPSAKPAQTTRQYERFSSGANSQANRSNRLMGALTGKSSSNGARPR